jgi:hypothetical protein
MAVAANVKAALVAAGQSALVGAPQLRGKGRRTKLKIQFEAPLIIISQRPLQFFAILL